jgi:hypothetical protein
LHFRADHPDGNIENVQEDAGYLKNGSRCQDIIVVFENAVGMKF